MCIRDSYYVNRGIGKLSKKHGCSSLPALALAGLSGALTNTLLVMHFIFLFFAEPYAAANQVTVSALYGFILTVIGINGVPEAIVAAIFAVVIGKVLFKLKLGNTARQPASIAEN